MLVNFKFSPYVFEKNDEKLKLFSGNFPELKLFIRKIESYKLILTSGREKFLFSDAWAIAEAYMGFCVGCTYTV